MPYQLILCHLLRFLQRQGLELCLESRSAWCSKNSPEKWTYEDYSPRIRSLAKVKYICKKSNQEMFAISPYVACLHAVVIMQILNLTNQCSLFMTVRHTFEISEDDQQPFVTHARNH